MLVLFSKKQHKLDNVLFVIKFYQTLSQKTSALLVAVKKMTGVRPSSPLFICLLSGKKLKIKPKKKQICITNALSI